MFLKLKNYIVAGILKKEDLYEYSFISCKKMDQTNYFRIIKDRQIHSAVERNLEKKNKDDNIQKSEAQQTNFNMLIISELEVK